MFFNMINLTLFQRNTPGGFSLENITRALAKNMPKEVEAKIFISSYRSRGFLDRIKAAWEARKHQGDINHITGDVHFLTFFLSKKRTILTIPDCERLMSRDYNILKKAIYRFFWFILPQWRCACITTISEESKKNLIRYTGISPERIRVIHAGVDDQFRVLDLGIDEKKRLLHNAKGRMTVLHVGVDHKVKNIQRLIESLVGLDVKFIKVGKMSDEEVNFLKDNKVDYLHFQNLEIDFLVQVYNSVDCLVFPSLVEGFGLPVVEAQRCGCPVVTSNISSLPEVAGDGAVFVDPYSVESIRAGIQKVLGDGQFREGLIQKGFQNVRRFSWFEIAKSYSNLYQEVVPDGRGAARV